MGLCWHEFVCPDYKEGQYVDPVTLICKKCAVENYKYDLEFKMWSSINQPLDFSTWQGFGTLWEWAIKQEWWYQFKVRHNHIPNHKLYGFDLDYINPEKFADALYKFLKERRKP